MKREVVGVVRLAVAEYPVSYPGQVALDLLAARLVEVTFGEHLVGRRAVVPVSDVFARLRRERIGGGHELVSLDVEVGDTGELLDVSGENTRVRTLDSGRRYQ